MLLPAVNRAPDSRRGRGPRYDAPVMRRGAALALVPLGWAALAIGLSRIPPLVAAAPCLGVVRGPLGWVLAGLALGVTLARLLDGLWHPALPSPRVLMALPALAFAITGLHYASRLKVSGDEPHYLLMAQSLWRERDLDLRDNFARGDFREYVPALIAPHYGAPLPDGRPFPAHGAGLPLLLAPIYALGGRAACVLFLALCAGLLCDQTRRLSEAVIGQRDAALWAWAVAVGPPVFFYSFHIYTEMPSALALAFALRMLLT